MLFIHSMWNLEYALCYPDGKEELNPCLYKPQEDLPEGDNKLLRHSSIMHPKP